MSMYLQNVGRKAKLLEEQEATRAKLRADLESLQCKADPLADPLELDEAAIAALGMAAAEGVVRLRGLSQQLAAVCKALGQ